MTEVLELKRNEANLLHHLVHERQKEAETSNIATDHESTTFRAVLLSKLSAILIEFHKYKTCTVCAEDFKPSFSEQTDCEPCVQHDREAWSKLL